MLYRKIESLIKDHFELKNDKILLIDGARQIGKTYIVRYVGQKCFKNFVEVNMLEDSLHDRLFANVRTKEDFYFQLSAQFGMKLGRKEDTLVFIDEIQAYPELLTLLKFLADDGRFTYVASGSLLGVTLAETSSIPMGRIRLMRMYPLDFEEFLRANGWNDFAIETLRGKCLKRESLDEATHAKVMGLFRTFLLIGGLPDAVNEFLATRNIVRVREIHADITRFYAMDAAKYDAEKRLKIRRIYELIPSNMENKCKRVVAQRIEDKRGKTFGDYQDEFDYLVNSGIALQVQAVANPTFPLAQSTDSAFVKFYMNDPGLLSAILYGPNIRAVLDDRRSVNLGALYETVVASELAAHGHKLHYYYNRAKGEVDYLIDDFDSLAVMPIEVKSGRDYRVHSAISTFVSNPDYGVREAIVLSNEREISRKGAITYLPIYFVQFL